MQILQFKLFKCVCVGEGGGGVLFVDNSVYSNITAIINYLVSNSSFISKCTCFCKTI